MTCNRSDSLDFVSWQGARSAEPEHMRLYVRIRASQQRRHGTKDGAAGGWLQ